MKATISKVRNLLGYALILSALSKAMDVHSYGVTVKAFLAFVGINVSPEYGVWVACLVCTTELMLGLWILRKEYAHIGGVGTYVLLSFYAVFTYANYRELYHGVESCTYLGNIVHLDAEQMFYKNIVLLLLALSVLPSSLKQWMSGEGRWSWRNPYLWLTAGVSILLPLYSYALKDILLETVYAAIYLLFCIGILCIPCCKYLRRKRRIG